MQIYGDLVTHVEASRRERVAVIDADVAAVNLSAGFDTETGDAPRVFNRVRDREREKHLLRHSLSVEGLNSLTVSLPSTSIESVAIIKTSQTGRVLRYEPN